MIGINKPSNLQPKAGTVSFTRAVVTKRGFLLLPWGCWPEHESPIALTESSPAGCITAISGVVSVAKLPSPPVIAALSFLGFPSRKNKAIWTDNSQEMSFIQNDTEAGPVSYPGDYNKGKMELMAVAKGCCLLSCGHVALKIHKRLLSSLIMSQWDKSTKLTNKTWINLSHV